MTRISCVLILNMPDYLGWLGSNLNSWFYWWKLCWSNLVFSAGTWSYTSSSAGCCFYNMTVPVNSVVLCSVLLQAIIFFHSIQLIFGRVDSSFSVLITHALHTGAIHPTGSSQEPKGKMFCGSKNDFVSEKVCEVIVLVCGECGLL